MKAITTTYRGPTTFRGSRIIARAEGVPRLILPYDHASHDPHRDAAEALAVRQGWEGTLLGGTLPDGTRVWVFADPCDFAEALNHAQRRLAERVVRGEVA